MAQEKFGNLLLKTVFSCMACDGHIDKREIKFLKEIVKEIDCFKNENIAPDFDSLINQINEKGHEFLKDYFNELKHSDLSESQEILIIDFAIRAIKADEKEEYSEIKFFKIIRSYLKVSNRIVLSKMPEIEEYLEQDIISEKYIESITQDYFESHSLPRFDLVSQLDDDDINISQDNEPA